MLKLNKFAMAALAVVALATPAMAQDVLKEHKEAKEALEKHDKEVKKAKLWNGFKAELDGDEKTVIERAHAVVEKVNKADNKKEKFLIVKGDEGRSIHNIGDRLAQIREGKLSKQGILRTGKTLDELEKVPADVKEVLKSAAGESITKFIPDVRGEVTAISGFYARLADKRAVKEEDVVSKQFSVAVAKLAKDLEGIELVQARTQRYIAEADATEKAIADLEAVKPDEKAGVLDNIKAGLERNKRVAELKSKLGELVKLEQAAVEAMANVKPVEEPRTVSQDSLDGLVATFDAHDRAQSKKAQAK